MPGSQIFSIPLQGLTVGGHQDLYSGGVGYVTFVCGSGKSKEMIEIIPVSSGGQTVVEKILRISAVSLDGKTLPDTHWANLYSTSQLKNNRVVCLSNSCCIDEFEQFIPENSASVEKSITSILSNGDSQLLNNRDGATFYSKSFNAQSWQGSKSRLAISWKNFRENTVFCYPPVDTGTEASFMTII